MWAQSNTNILYIEASTVNRWKIKEWPERLGVKDVTIDFKGVYDFDKTEVLMQSVQNSDPKPDYVILQECSVYFPGQIDEYKQKLESWVNTLNENDIVPVIATTVPPAKSTNFIDKVKAAIKEYILQRPSQLDQVAEFNDWLRSYSEKNSVHLIDLEKELRISEESRYMNPIYDSGDNIHLNKSAYQKLDGYFHQRLNQILEKKSE